MDTNSLKEKTEEGLMQMVDRLSGAAAALELIKQTAINETLTPEKKMARIHYILLLNEGKVTPP